MQEAGVRANRKKKCHLRAIVLLAAVLFIVQILGLLLGVVLGALTVDKVETLGLGHLVDLGSGQGSEGLLGKSMADLLAFLALLFLPQVHGLPGGRPADELVGELGLVLLGDFIRVVHLVTGVLGLGCERLMLVRTGWDGGRHGVGGRRHDSVTNVAKR